jgi:hypothetical protein
MQSLLSAVFSCFFAFGVVPSPSATCALSAPSDTISPGTAKHYRHELRSGKSCHEDHVLTPAERAVRIAALRRWGGGLSERYARELRKDLEGFEKSMKDLTKQGEDHYRAAMAQSILHHDETQMQLAGLHAKVDGLAGSSEGVQAVTALITRGEVQPLRDDQTKQQRSVSCRTPSASLTASWPFAGTRPRRRKRRGS